VTTPSADDARPADDAGRASAPGQTPPTGEAPEPNVPQSTADIEGTPGHPGPALDAEAAAEQARLTAAHADAAAAAHAAGHDEAAAEEAELAVTAADESYCPVKGGGS